MTSPSVVIISKDTDFAQELAMHASHELALECAVAADEAEAKAYGRPMVTVTPPVRLRGVLADIASAASKQAADITLRADYVLQPRQKSLLHTPSGQSVTLTDKEAHLLQSIAAAGQAGVSKEQLLRDVWGIELPMDTHTLETHIYRLRGKCRELAGEELVEATLGGYKIK